MWYDVDRGVGVDVGDGGVDCRNVGLNDGVGGDDGVSDDPSWY